MVFAQSYFVPEQASSIAEKVDQLNLFLVVVSVFFTLLIAFLVLYFGIKYRRKPGNEVANKTKGSLKLELAGASIPLVVGLIIFVWGANIFVEMRTPPEDSLDVFVVGKQWMWKAQHPGGEMDPPNELHVPVNQPVRLIMTSEDVIHDFYVPAFRVKQDVLPGRYTTMWFKPTKIGTFDFVCAEYCGTEHSQMRGYVHVLSEADYQKWLESRAQFSAVLKGKQLFLQQQCITCHNADGQAYAPLLENLHGKKVRLDNGETATADWSYLKQSIENPNAKIVAGYRKDFMPAYTKLKAEEINQLIAFIKSLGPGDTPKRVEDRPPQRRKDSNE